MTTTTETPAAEQATEAMSEELKAALVEATPWIQDQAIAWGQRNGYRDHVNDVLTDIFGNTASNTKPSDEVIATVKQYIVDQSLASFRKRGWCPDATQALTGIFGRPEGGRWRDSNGYDCAGFNADGYNKDGVNINGYRADGRYRGTDPDGVVRWFDRNTALDEDGFNERGFNADNVNRHGKRRDGTWVSVEAQATFLLKDASPEVLAAVAVKLAEAPAPTA